MSKHSLAQTKRTAAAITLHDVGHNSSGCNVIFVCIIVVPAITTKTAHFAAGLAGAMGVWKDVTHLREHGGRTLFENHTSCSCFWCSKRNQWYHSCLSGSTRSWGSCRVVGAHWTSTSVGAEAFHLLCSRHPTRSLLPPEPSSCGVQRPKSFALCLGLGATGRRAAL